MVIRPLVSPQAQLSSVSWSDHVGERGADEVAHLLVVHHVSCHLSLLFWRGGGREGGREGKKRREGARGEERKKRKGESREEGGGAWEEGGKKKQKI